MHAGRHRLEVVGRLVHERRRDQVVVAPVGLEQRCHLRLVGALAVEIGFQLEVDQPVRVARQRLFQGGNPEVVGAVARGRRLVTCGDAAEHVVLRRSVPGGADAGHEPVGGIQLLEFRQCEVGDQPGAVGGAIHVQVVDDHQLVVSGLVDVHFQHNARIEPRYLAVGVEGILREIDHAAPVGIVQRVFSRGHAPAIGIRLLIGRHAGGVIVGNIACGFTGGRGGVTVHGEGQDQGFRRLLLGVTENFDLNVRGQHPGGNLDAAGGLQVVDTGGGRPGGRLVVNGDRPRLGVGHGHPKQHASHLPGHALGRGHGVDRQGRGRNVDKGVVAVGTGGEQRRGGEECGSEHK